MLGMAGGGELSQNYNFSKNLLALVEARRIEAHLLDGNGEARGGGGLNDNGGGSSADEALEGVVREVGLELSKHFLVLLVRHN